MEKSSLIETKPSSSSCSSSYNSSATILSCECQKVQIATAFLPIDRVECCCCDCRLAVRWCHETLGGPAARRPDIVDLLYFPNALRILQPDDDIEQGGVDSVLALLRVYMIQKGYNTRRVVATCCGTPMLGDHPNYRRRKFVSFQPPACLRIQKQKNDLDEDQKTNKKVELEPSNVSTDEQLYLPPQRRIFMQDLSAKQKESIPAFMPPSDASKTAIYPPSLQRLPAERYTTAQTLIEHLAETLYMMDSDYQGKQPKCNREHPPKPSHEGK